MSIIVTKEDFEHLDFSGGEVNVRLKTTRLSGDGNVVLKFQPYNSDDIFRLLLMTDALRRFDDQWKVSLKMPYFPYARQDRVCNPGEALSGAVMAQIINSQNYEHVTVWDAHSDVVPALLNRCDNLHCANFVDKIKDVNKMTLIAPDAGAIKKVKFCAEVVHGEHHGKFFSAHKTRDTATGEITGVGIDVDHIDGPVLIVDDICDGGRTFVELAKVLKPKMGGHRLCLYVTHGIFSKGLDRLYDHFSTVYCANPWPKYARYVERF